MLDCDCWFAHKPRYILYGQLKTPMLSSVKEFHHYEVIRIEKKPYSGVTQLMDSTKLNFTLCDQSSPLAQRKLKFALY